MASPLSWLRSSRAHSLLRPLFAVPLALASCARGAPPPPPPVTASAGAPVVPDLEAQAARWRSWEPTGLSPFHVELPGGVLVADVEAKSPPTTECHKDDSGQLLCTLVLDLGLDPEGTAHNLMCDAAWFDSPVPFGLLVNTALEGATLNEMPRFSTSWSTGPDGGVVARFTAPITGANEQGTVIGTAKYSARYTGGLTLFCHGGDPGGEKAAERISNRFFETAVAKKDTTQTSLSIARKVRSGDRVIGFEYEYVRKHADGRFTEVRTMTNILSTEKAWQAHDGTRIVERDPTGRIVSIRGIAAVAGELSVVLSAKPSEGGRFRLKLEGGGKSEALELTPQEQLGTALWDAPALLRVSKGTSKSHRLAFLQPNAEGEPSFGYLALTRIKPGVLVEETTAHGDTAKGKPGDELTVDDRGFVTKSTTADTVAEAMHVSGALPTVEGSAKRPSAKR